MWITPKLDWTRNDYYNFEDLNRVENNSEVVAELVGYFIGLPPLSFLTDRSMKRIEFADSLNRIEGNQDVLRQRHTPYGWIHRIAGRDAQKVPKKVEGKAEDVRLDAVDLWENRNLFSVVKYAELERDSNSANFYTLTDEGYLLVRNIDSRGSAITIYKYILDVIEGMEYIFHSEVPLYWRMYLHDADGAMVQAITSSSIRNSMTFTPIQGATRLTMKFYTDGVKYPYPVVLPKLKLEQGSTATPWQPAPEDNIPWYQPVKTVELAPVNLSSLDQYENSIIQWEADTPEGTRVAVEYSLDRESWTPIQSGKSLPFKNGEWLTGKIFFLRQRLFTNDQSITPAIRNFRYEINGYQTKVEWKANDPFDYNDALRLEYNLKLLYEHYKGNTEIVPICGAFICGEEVI